MRGHLIRACCSSSSRLMQIQSEESSKPEKNTFYYGPKTGYELAHGNDIQACEID
jgi:hypothetical protein